MFASSTRINGKDDYQENMITYNRIMANDRIITEDRLIIEDNKENINFDMV